MGDYGNYEPRLDWGYVDWRPKNWLGFRGGKFKRPNGLYNETLDVDAARTFILLPQSVYNYQYRDFLLATTGVGGYGNIDLGSGGDLDYQLYYGLPNTETGGGNAGEERLGGGGAMFTTESSERLFGLGFSFLWNAPVDGLRTGITLSPLNMDHLLSISPFLQMRGMPPTTVVEMRMKKWVASAEYTKSQFRFTGEYSWGTGGLSNPFFAKESTDVKYYVMGTYRVNDLFEIGSYYSANFDDKNDKDGLNFDPYHSAFQKDWAMTLRVDPVRYLIFKIEYHMVDGSNSLTQELNPDGIEKDWNYFTSKITFAF
jgi:hypothetical protein